MGLVLLGLFSKGNHPATRPEAAVEPQLARTVVIAAVAGNAHELGAHAISILFERAGWRVFCTGADTPAEDVALLCERADADLLALSATIATQREAAALTIERVRASRPEQLVLVGGEAFGENDQLWRRIGANARARNGGDAVLLSAELCGLGD